MRGALRAELRQQRGQQADRVLVILVVSSPSTSAPSPTPIRPRIRGHHLVRVGAAPGQRLHVAEDQVLAVLVDAELLQKLQYHAEVADHQPEPGQPGPFEGAAGRRQHLGVGGRAGRADALDADLGELAVPPALRLLVAEGRPGVVDAGPAAAGRGGGRRRRASPRRCSSGRRQSFRFQWVKLYIRAAISSPDLRRKRSRFSRTGVSMPR